jgi:site-specific DNA recombinase
MTTRAAIYTRISLDKAGDERAVERQEEDCRRVIEARGWEVAGTYQDNSISATSGRRRPSYDRLIDDIKAGKVDAVVVWRLDRLTRKMIQALDWIDLNRTYGVNLITIEQGIDLATASGRAFLKQIVSFAELEIENKADRQERAFEQKRKSGAPITGRKVMGWEADGVTLVEEEAALVRETFDAVLSGATLSGAARQWNDLGYRTSGTSGADAARSNGGGPWTAVSMRKLLTNPRYAGFRADADGTLYEGKWPAIVPEETWRAAVELISHPARRKTPGPERRHLLSGLALCGIEGCVDSKGNPSRMKAGASRSGVTVYRCATRAHLARKSGIIDDYITERIIVRLTRRDAAELLRANSAPDVAAIRSDLLAKRERRASLGRLLSDGVLTEADVRQDAPRLDAEVAALEARLTETGRTDVLGPLVGAADVREVWEGLSIDRRRAAVDLLMRVTIKRIGGGRHENLKPQTIGIDWRV